MGKVFRILLHPDEAVNASTINASRVNEHDLCLSSELREIVRLRERKKKKKDKPASTRCPAPFWQALYSIKKKKKTLQVRHLSRTRVDFQIISNLPSLAFTGLIIKVTRHINIRFYAWLRRLLLQQNKVHLLEAADTHGPERFPSSVSRRDVSPSCSFSRCEDFCPHIIQLFLIQSRSIRLPSRPDSVRYCEETASRGIRWWWPEESLYVHGYVLSRNIMLGGRLRARRSDW